MLFDPGRCLTRARLLVDSLTGDPLLKNIRIVYEIIQEFYVTDIHF